MTEKCNSNVFYCLVIIGYDFACTFVVTDVDPMYIYRYCCSASSYDRVAIPCDGYEMLVYVVTSCGCFECAEPNLVYAGIARGIDGTALS